VQSHDLRVDCEHRPQAQGAPWEKESRDGSCRWLNRSTSRRQPAKILVIEDSLYNENNPTKSAAIIYASTTSALWKERPKPIHLRVTQPIKIAHSIPHLWGFESCRHNSIK
jgi:hypothetical protein